MSHTSKWAFPLVLGGILLLVWLTRKAAPVFESAVINKIAQAIARAEGFYVAGSRPARNHNPGNMTLDLVNKGIGKDGPFIVYRNDQDGFDNLRRQIWLMFGGSRIYSATMTIAEVAALWTTTEQKAWASNVAKALGVTVDTRLTQIA